MYTSYGYMEYGEDTNVFSKNTNVRVLGYNHQGKGCLFNCRQAV